MSLCPPRHSCLSDFYISRWDFFTVGEKSIEMHNFNSVIKIPASRRYICRLAKKVSDRQHLHTCYNEWALGLKINLTLSHFSMNRFSFILLSRGSCSRSLAASQSRSKKSMMNRARSRLKISRRKWFLLMTSLPPWKVRLECCCSHRNCY